MHSDLNKSRVSLWLLSATAVIVAAMIVAPRVTMSSLPTESPARVQVCEVTRGAVEQALCVTARVRYEAEYAAVVPCAGIIRQVYVAPGDRVRAGQALFRMDGTAQEAALAAAISDAPAALVPDSLGNAAVEASAALSQWTARETDATLRQAEAALSQLTVRAQADGLVHQVDIAENSGALAGTPAVALSGTQQLLTAQVVARDAASLRVGMAARVMSGSDLLCTASVRSIGAVETDATTGQTVTLVTLCPETPLDLPIGAAVDAEIILYGQQNVPTLPLSAVDEDGTVRWIADGRCYRLPVEVVMADEVNCWVNLPEGLRVVLHGGETVEGQRVREVRP